MTSLFVVIAGMTIVTFVPRLAAVAATSHVDTLPRWSRRWLRGIPYAIFGALIVPGAWTSVPGSPEASLVGAGVGVALALCKIPSIVCVLASLGAAAAFQAFAH